MVAAIGNFNSVLICAPSALCALAASALDAFTSEVDEDSDSPQMAEEEAAAEDLTSST